MEDKYPETPQDVDLETEARVRADFGELIRKPFRPERLEEFAGVSRRRAEIVQKAVWGQIRWSKSIGRPSSPHLADGFRIEHRFHVFDEVITEDGEDDFNVDFWLLNPYLLSKWDLEDDDNFYVAFRSVLIPDNDNKVEVRFADNVPWKRTPGSTGRGIRLIGPTERFFNLKDDPRKVIVLEDFQVIFRHTTF
ncbi:MAG TPA: hypothetical protein VFX96_09500 [Pyrinomonadaceae bacterium]|nr:hypothetical protein [Pyrinomonadaceae bacterium]